MADLADAQKIDNFLGALAVVALLETRARETKCMIEKIRSNGLRTAHDDVIDDRHGREQSDILKGARDPDPCCFARRQARIGLTRETDGAVLRTVESADDVEERALPGTVGAY